MTGHSEFQSKSNLIYLPNLLNIIWDNLPNYRYIGLTGLLVPKEQLNIFRIH